MHLGAGQVERGCDDGNRVGRHVAELVLDGVQDREQGTGPMAILLDGDGDGRFPGDGGHTAAARLGAPTMRVRTKSAMASGVVQVEHRNTAAGDGGIGRDGDEVGIIETERCAAVRRAIDLELETALEVESLGE